MPAPPKIIELVENFDRNIEQLKRARNMDIYSLVYKLYGLSAENIQVVEGGE